MVKPDRIIYINDGPRKAIRAMKQEGFSNIYVVDRYNRVEGVIEDTAALEALRNKEQTVKDYIDKDYPYASLDTPLK